jgi:hypothetical protein
MSLQHIVAHERPIDKTTMSLSKAPFLVHILPVLSSTVTDFHSSAIPLNVPSETTIGDLTTRLQSETSLPSPISANVRLLHGGRHLSNPSSTLTALSIPPEATISLAMPPKSTTAPSGGKKGGLPKCDYKKTTADKCTARIAPVIGDCGFCKGHFCAKHRLLESHDCEGLEDCKKESHERNAERLQKERTVAIKGL